MKIICEHCGSSINIDKDSKCPNCKAPYKNNKDYIKLKKIFEKEKDLDLKNKEANIELKNVVKDTLIHTNKFAIIVKVISAIIIFLSIGLIIYTTINMHKLNPSNINKKDNENPITVKFNEEATSSKYTIKCDDVKERNELMFKDPKEGYTFYTFHILLENLDKEEIFIFDSEISCIVDGVVQNNVTWFDDIDSHINKVIEPNTKVQGNFTFEVPKDTKTFDLKYKNTTIHIKI